MASPIEDVNAERKRQDRRWGEQDHPDACPVLTGRPGGATSVRMAQDVEIPTAPRAQFTCRSAAKSGRLHWSAILVEEVAEAVDAIGDDDQLYSELIQVAAVAVAWAEAIKRRGVTRG